jgi:hypothetical protein
LIKITPGTGVFSTAPGSFFSIIIEAAVATGFYAGGLSLAENPKERKAGSGICPKER